LEHWSSVYGNVVAMRCGSGSGLGASDGEFRFGRTVQRPDRFISPTAQELKTLKAALASREISTSPESNAMSFCSISPTRSDSTPTDNIISKLATHNPVREPFLHFLIQVDWSGGHLIREYSALLDPPQWVAGAAAAEINVPATSAPEVASVVEAAPVVAAPLLKPHRLRMPAPIESCLPSVQHGAESRGGGRPRSRSWR